MATLLVGFLSLSKKEKKRKKAKGKEETKKQAGKQ